MPGHRVLKIWSRSQVLKIWSRSQVLKIWSRSQVLKIWSRSQILKIWSHELRQPSSENMERGRRLWLTIVDPTAEGEPEALWVEVSSSDPDSMVVVLVSEDALMQPIVRHGSEFEGAMNAFQTIKLTAEYALDTMGRPQADSMGRPQADTKGSPQVSIPSSREMR